MNYLLDTNCCVQLIHSTSNTVRRVYEEALLEGAELFLSVIVLHELQYGVAKSSLRYASQERLNTFLATPLTLLSFDQQAASAAASIRADLESRKQPIGPYDTLIAGQALARDLTLVTANVREFARVRGLRWQDWAAKP